ncbi:low temperature requirement protein A [Rugosimonospora acidiphila]|uniref:low temperature requirement protein A n=1 Tax=Rugosimonospora acidiphila TaxID=556531 RepID=UPI0031E7752F
MWVTRLSRIADRLRLRYPGGPDAEQERHATWLELFFDLVFVLALSGVTARLGTGSPDAARIGVAIGLFVLVQWAWIGQAFYDTRFDPDDVPHRLLVLIAGAGAGAIALGVRDVPVGVLLPIGYLVVRGALLLMYLRVLTADRSNADLVAVYGAGFGTGWLLWLTSLFLPIEIRPVLWIIALGVELATPWLGRRWLSRYPVHVSHLPERLGQFTIILLGSTLTNLRDAVPTAHPPIRTLVAASLGILPPIGIWWIYTTFVASGLPVRRLGNGQAYAYLHTPAGVAVLFIGWGLGEAAREVDGGAHTMPLGVRLVYGGSLIGWMACGLGLNWFALGRLHRYRLAIGALGATPIAVVIGVPSAPTLVLAVTSAVFVGYAALVNPQLVRVREQL